MKLLREAARKAYEQHAAAERARALLKPRPAPSKPATASDNIIRRKERAKRLEGYSVRRGPKGRKKLCAPLNCYPFADWWKRAVEKALTAQP